MLFIENTSHDPYFNIAAEEYLLKYFDKEIVAIWRSTPSIIVGKHQNTLEEINLDYVRKNNIPVIRRLSGGGTVFHDLGNLNFTFIRKTSKEKMVDFRAHVAPVISFLQGLGINARFEGKNDLRVKGLKISGNAEHIYKDKVLHHGTLLFNSDLTGLNEAIKGREEAFNSKSVKSIRSVVTNISDHLNIHLSVVDFEQQLKEYLLLYFGDAEPYRFDESDIRTIEKIKEEKYTTWGWNFGYSPTYSLTGKGMINDRSFELNLTVARGKIVSLSVLNDHTGLKFSEAENILQGVDHNPQEIELKLEETGFFKNNGIEDRWLFIRSFF